MIMIGHTFQQYLLKLKEFQWFQKVSLKLNMEKHQLFQKEV
jgi:hypothetical protein